MGQSWEDAAFLIEIRDMYLAAGLTAQEAETHVQAYWDAIHEGDRGAILDQQEAWDALRETIEEDTAAVEDFGAETVHSAAAIGAQFRGLTEEEAEKLGDALLDLGHKANRAFTRIHDSALGAGSALANVLLPALHDVTRAINAIPTDIRIKAHVASSGIPGRAAGGPVLPGMPYMVGERGPEPFIPSDERHDPPEQHRQGHRRGSVARAAGEPTGRRGAARRSDRRGALPHGRALVDPPVPREHGLMYHVRLRGADISERVVRGSVSITGALGERRSASMRVRVPEGVTLAPADLDELTIDYPGLPYRAAADALDPVAYWALDEARGDRPLLSALPPLPPLRAREALPGRALVAVSLFDSAMVGGDTDPNISDATPGCLLSFQRRR